MMQEAEIEKYRYDHAFLRKMAEQTVTDFARMGLHLDWKLSEPPAFVDYCRLLSPFICHWAKEDNQKLMAALYHIDLPDKMLKGLVSCQHAEELASNILKRELIKVILKKLYTS